MAFLTLTALSTRRAPTPTLSARTPPKPQGPGFSRTTMIAVEPATEPAADSTTTTTLSLKARELLGYVRGHKSIFHPGARFTATHCALFRKNDTGRVFTPLDELATNAYMLPGGSVAALMVVQENQLVEAACAVVFDNFPAVKADDTLAEILSFDLRYLLRVISYGVACQATDFLHMNNIGLMRMLHREVGLPATADICGLQNAKEAVLAQTDSALADSTAACFDVVIDNLS